MSQEELLDVLDESGAVIGVKSRAQVHADCNWHGLVFVWSAWNQDGQAVMMMQRRGRAGDRFIAQIDALAGEAFGWPQAVGTGLVVGGVLGGLALSRAARPEAPTVEPAPQPTWTRTSLDAAPVSVSTTRNRCSPV